MSEVVALFSTRSEAEQATDELLARGYDSERIGYLDRYRDETGEVVTNEEYFDDDAFEQSEVLDEATKGVAGGAVGGAAVGASAGLLASGGLLLGRVSGRSLPPGRWERPDWTPPGVVFSAGSPGPSSVPWRMMRPTTKSPVSIVRG